MLMVQPLPRPRALSPSAPTPPLCKSVLPSVALALLTHSLMGLIWIPAQHRASLTGVRIAVVDARLSRCFLGATDEVSTRCCRCANKFGQASAAGAPPADLFNIWRDDYMISPAEAAAEVRADGPALAISIFVPE